MNFDIRQLSETVRFNCDVADANFAGNYTMCIYLLKMRELYRWSNEIEQTASLVMPEVSAWVENKEAYWESVEDKEFQPIHIGDHDYDPFDVESINQQISQYGLVYGAGYGRGCRPQFYLGRLYQQENYPAYDVLISDHELARDLASPVAMSQGRRIYVRRESMRRMLWESIEAWQWRKSPTNDPMARALQNYNLEDEPELVLDALLEHEIEYAINHEVGEIAAGELLGDEWELMLQYGSGGLLELLARAIRDHLADALVTLPSLVANGDSTAIHLYFANLTALRKMLFPGLVEHYVAATESGRYAEILNQAVAISREHWLDMAQQLLQDFRQQGESFCVTEADLPGFRLSGLH